MLQCFGKYSEPLHLFKSLCPTEQKPKENDKNVKKHLTLYSNIVTN